MTDSTDVSSDEGGEVLTEVHYPTTPVQCACGWRQTDPNAGTWVGHMSADRLAAVQAERDQWQRLAEDAGRERDDLRAERDDLREMLRIGTELDNHHNADVCPYCTPKQSAATPEEEVPC